MININNHYLTCFIGSIIGHTIIIGLLLIISHSSKTINTVTAIPNNNSNNIISTNIIDNMYNNTEIVSAHVVDEQQLKAEVDSIQQKNQAERSKQLAIQKQQLQQKMQVEQKLKELNSKHTKIQSTIKQKQQKLDKVTDELDEGHKQLSNLTSEQKKIQIANQQLLLQQLYSKAKAKIQSRITENWIKNSCEGCDNLPTLQVNLATDGSVANAKVLVSSGSDACDESAMLAIYKAAPFDFLDDNKVYERYKSLKYEFK